jgi:hypothetical protein
MSIEQCVTVVIPTYNRAAFLREAIASVVGQTYTAWELIVVDDGSTDDTERVLEEYASDPRIRVIRQQQRERGAARNAGIAAAQGDYIAFLDSDDWWDAGHLAACVAAIDRAPSSRVAYAGSRQATGPGQLVGRQRLEVLHGHPARDIVRRFDAAGCNASSCIVARDVLEQLGGFNEDLALSGSEDWELWVRLGQRTTFACTGNYTVWLRQHDAMTSRDANRMVAAMQRAMQYVLANEALAPVVEPVAAEGQSRMQVIIAVNYYASGDMRRARRHLGLAMRHEPYAAIRQPLLLYTWFRTLLGGRLSQTLRRSKQARASRRHQQVSS